MIRRVHLIQKNKYGVTRSPLKVFIHRCDDGPPLHRPWRRYEDVKIPGKLEDVTSSEEEDGGVGGLDPAMMEDKTKVNHCINANES